MPIREYICDNCGKFELIQGINESILTTCPKCNRDGLVHQFGAPAKPKFVGHGFYETDYGKKYKT